MKDGGERFGSVFDLLQIALFIGIEVSTCGRNTYQHNPLRVFGGDISKKLLRKVMVAVQLEARWYSLKCFIWWIFSSCTSRYVLIHRHPRAGVLRYVQHDDS